MESCQFHVYLEKVLGLADATNRYIDKTAPFKLSKDASQRDRLATILYNCAEAVRIILLYLHPVMPATADRGMAQLGCRVGDQPLGRQGRWGGLQVGTKTQKGEGLFPRKQ
jgi:methionyl-tRNA synthetase